MPRDVLAPRDRDAGLVPHRGEDPVQRPNPSGTADHPEVKLNRHHIGAWAPSRCSKSNASSKDRPQNQPANVSVLLHAPL
jgi:hypothetical protein